MTLTWAFVHTRWAQSLWDLELLYIQKLIYNEASPYSLTCAYIFLLQISTFFSTAPPSPFGRLVVPCVDDGSFYDSSWSFHHWSATFRWSGLAVKHRWCHSTARFHRQPLWLICSHWFNHIFYSNKTKKWLWWWNFLVILNGKGFFFLLKF